MRRSKPYYPVFLDLQGRHCLVIGGDREALRKVRGLLECRARITLIAPKAVPELAELARQGQIAWRRRPYQPGDLAGAFLAIATPQVASRFAALHGEATAERVLLNTMDEPSLCVWIAPSLVRRGPITIAVSTGGRSPAFARWLREYLERLLPEEVFALGELMIELREELRADGHQAVPPDRWQLPPDHEVVSLLAQGRREEAKDLYRKRLLAPQAERPAQTKAVRG
jgi:precorrin-2 dehydrogenase/sirohydrochlorin ferrochelatase